MYLHYGVVDLCAAVDDVWRRVYERLDSMLLLPNTEHMGELLPVRRRNDGDAFWMWQLGGFLMNRFFTMY